MNKQTLEEIKTILVDQYLNEKDKILEDELNGNIGSCRATEQRTKLIGMMTAVEIIQREIKKIEMEFEYRPFKYYTGFIIPNYGTINRGVIVSKNDYRYYIDTKDDKGKDTETILSEIQIDNIMEKYNELDFIKS
jgi:hypothetical protein